MFKCKKSVGYFLFIVIFGQSCCIKNLYSQQNKLENKIENIVVVDYCQKLNKHMLLLAKFNNLNKQKKLIDVEDIIKAVTLEENIGYKNDTIKKCLEDMCKEHSLDPFFKTWDYAYQMCIANKDLEFVREFSILIFSIYENILAFFTICTPCNFKDGSNKNLFDDIIQVYNVISELPIREIIVTLEKCYTLFSKILNDYGLTSGLTFGQWIKKYWWLPPTVVFAVVAAIFSKSISNKIVKSFSGRYKDKSILYNKVLPAV